jgi:hypothetical protein
MENCTHELWVQIQKMKGELETFCKLPSKVFQTTYKDNQLKEFEELFLDNTLLKVQNQTLTDKNLKWKEWWQTMQEIIEKQIQDSLDITHANEKAYLNELVVYWLHLESYKYDQVIGKLVEIPINVFQKNSPMQTTNVATSSQSKLVVIINEEPKPIKGGIKMAIISYTLPLPTKPVEIPIVTVNT